MLTKVLPRAKVHKILRMENVFFVETQNFASLRIIAAQKKYYFYFFAIQKKFLKKNFPISKNLFTFVVKKKQIIMDANKINIYLSYELTYSSDVENFYKWLDNHEAKNTGIGSCVFSYNVANEGSTIEQKAQKTIENLKNDLYTNIRFRKGDRVFISSQLGAVKISGFLLGDYRRAPWEGYGDLKVQKNKVTFENEVFV